MKKVLLLTLFLFGCLLAKAQDVDYLKEANDCFEKGDYECAKKNYNLYQIWNGNDMSAEIQKADECLRTLNLADDYFKESEYQRARDFYKIVLEINPQDPYAKKQYDECEVQIQAAAPQTITSDSIQTAKTEHAPESKSSHSNLLLTDPSSNNDFKKNLFGVDLGIGARKVNEWGTFPELGFRWMHNFTPYFGWDVVNLKIQALIKKEPSFDECLLQGMTGLRVFSPAFMNNIKGYGSLKAGYGYQPHLKASGFAYELEIGVPFKNFTAGLVFNAQKLKGERDNLDFNFNSAYIGLRVGITF